MPRSIPRFLRETAERVPDKTAVVSRERSITFAELLDESLRTAECFREIGIQSGDRVGVCMEKTIDQVTTILGILFANAVLVPILPRLKQANIRHIIENSGMAALVTDSERLAEVSEFASLTKLVTGRGEIEEAHANIAYMRRHIQPRLFFDRIGADNAAIIYSSGSTGRPKGILIGHRQLSDGADIVSQYLGTTEDDRIGCVISLNFDYGLNQLWQTVATGCTLYLHDFALPNDLFAMLAKERITALPVMPVILTKMFDRRLKFDLSSHDLSAMRYVCSTGGRLSEQMLVDLRQAFPGTPIYSMFGLTEAFRATYLDPDMLDTHPTSVGKAIPGCRILVLDEEGKECPPNVAGELVQRGATVAKGYWRNPEATARVFRSHPDYPGETLVFSGDDVMRDEEGYLYFVGRRDEMIKTRGFRVSPFEVEAEVTRHPEINAAVAFAVFNIEVGEDIACAYSTVSGEPLPESTLLQFLKSNLPRHMVPRYLEHHATFPVTGNDGKIDRRAVKDGFFERHGLAAAPSPKPGILS